MPVDWQLFKSSLDNLKNVSIAYIDEEGYEIPIELECQFEEALKFAKANSKKQLKLILKPRNMKINDECREKKIEEIFQAKNKSELTESLESTFSTYFTSEMKKKTLNSDFDPLPVWFAHHLKKFRKRLLEEIKVSLNEAVHNAFKKEIKSLKIRMEAVEHAQNQFCEFINKSKNFHKEYLEYSKETREMNLAAKKSEKVQLSKFQKLESQIEKLDKQAKQLADERRHHCCKKSPEIMSASFRGNDNEIKCQPGREFSKCLTVENNGTNRWEYAKLFVVPKGGITLDRKQFLLSGVQPGSSCTVIIKGRAPPNAGLCLIKCRISGKYGELCKSFLITVKVTAGNSSDAENPTSNIFFNCQKKIEENINEIEKRLQNISFQPSSSESSSFIPPTKLNLDFCKPEENDGADGFLKKEVLSAVRDGKTAQNECLSLKDKDSFEDEYDNLADDKDDTNSNSELSILYISDEEDNFIVVQTPTNSPCLSEVKQDIKESADEVEKESILIPSGPLEIQPAQIFTPIPSTSTEKTDDCVTSILKPLNARESNEKTVVSENLDTSSAAKAETTPATVFSIKTQKNSTLDDESIREKKIISGRASKKIKKGTECLLARSRSPFALDSEESKAKKLRSSSESQFIGMSDPNQSKITFRSHSSGSCKTEKGSSGEKRKKKNAFRYNRSGRAKLRTIDAKGKVIFAVNSRGQCTPLEDILKREREEVAREARREKKKSDKMNSNRSNRLQNDIAVNILPGVLMNGASSMASLAFNTAKSVISNLQSAFIVDGKADMGRPAAETKKEKEYSMEALLHLYVMGFQDVETNKRLLIANDNDLCRVIDELVALNSDNSLE